MTEIELKLLIAEADAARLAKSPEIAALATGPAETRRLRSVYLDTPDGALADRGIALRLRHEGCRWTQTVKARRINRAGLSEAAECDVARPGPEADPAAIPDADLRAAVEAALGGAAPAPVCETEITRTVRRLSIARLGEVELAVDAGTVRAGGRSAPLWEAEIELLSGSPRAVFETARAAFPDGGPVLSRLSKGERGALLAAEGRIEPDPAPRNARRVAIAQGWTSERAAHAVLGECLDQIASNIDTLRRSDDPEGPHQLRVGLRRLRSACLVFRAAVGGPALDAIEREAQWLGHEVGVVRDLDVARADILAPLMAEEAAEPGLAELDRALAGHAGAARERLRDTLAGRRVWRFVLDLGEVLAARGWLDPADWEQTARLARPVEATIAEALDTRRLKAAAKAKGIAHLSIEARHELRKALKKLRYAAEFAAPLHPQKTVKPFLKKLKALQEVFGALNDFAMVEALFRQGDGPAAESMAAARAAGFVTGIHSERARRSWEEAKAAWVAFEATPGFWD